MNHWSDFNSASSQTNCKTDKQSTDQIRSQLLGRLQDVLAYLLPAGRIEGGAFKVGDVQGHAGSSLQISLNSGKPGLWQDFATGESGDIFDLWAACHRLDTKCDFPAVINSIKQWLGQTCHEIPTSAIPSSPPPVSKPSPGSLTAKWEYHDVDGNVISTVSRFDSENGKTFRLWDEINKRNKAPIPRPLFNQPGINKNDYIVLVEGEKCASALIEQGINATTAMGGANAPIDKTDWSPLQNKHVLIWPDNDKPGQTYADKLSYYLSENNITASIALLAIPSDKPVKWDAADAINDNINISEFIRTYATTTENHSPQSNNNRIIKIKPASWQGLPPERQWIIRNWLPRGYVTALYGDGGVGKSLLAQQLMTCLAAGKPWIGLHTEPLRVYGLMCEDDSDELWRRQYNINKSLQVSMNDLDNLCFVSRVGFNNLLMTFDGKDSGQLTDFFKSLLDDVTEFQADLIVLDTVADLFGGNEINRSQVRQFVQNACAKLARQINGAVLLCAHPSDSGMQRKTGTGGSTAWSNTVRSRWYLTRPDDEEADPNERILSRKKSNYAASGTDIHLIWNHGAFSQFTPDLNTKCVVGDSLAIKRDAERDRKKEIILEMIASEALEGRVYSSTTFAQKFEANPYRLGSESTIKRSIDRYATQGLIKFNQAPEQYGLERSSNSQGYLCVEGMQLATGRQIVNAKTGQTESEFVPFYPTHFKSERDSFCHRVEDPRIWMEKNNQKPVKKCVRSKVRSN